MKPTEALIQGLLFATPCSLLFLEKSVLLQTIGLIWAYLGWVAFVWHYKQQEEAKKNG